MMPALAVTANGVPVSSDVPPIVERSRVLLPARAVFTALGAAVNYDAATRRVEVRRGERSVRVTIGSDSALVDARLVRLDVAARLIGGRTFLPLRFIAESFGASVTYDALTRTVAILEPEMVLPAPVVAATPAASYPPPSVEQRRPAPGEGVTNTFPSISAMLATHGGPPVDPASVRVFLDGRDVTDRTYRSGDTIGYTPSSELATGVHEVTVQGADQTGRRFSATWDFQSTYAYVPPANPAYPLPAPPYPPAYWPALSGPAAYLSRDSVILDLIGPPGGWAYADLCGFGRHYPFVNGPDGYHYRARIALPPNMFVRECRVTGYFYDSRGYPTFFSLAQPLTIDTTSQRPGSVPTPKPTADPAHTRYLMTQPTPAPSASARPAPSARPSPRPSAAATKEPREPSRPL